MHCTLPISRTGVVQAAGHVRGTYPERWCDVRVHLSAVVWQGSSRGYIHILPIHTMQVMP